MRESGFESSSTSYRPDLGLTIAGPFPIVTMASLQFTHDRNLTRTRILSSTSVTKKKGIIRQINHFQNGSRWTNNNEYFDRSTGLPILVSASGEHNDRMYSYSEPAYWHNKGMGMADQTANLKLIEIDLNDDKDYLIDVLVPGDEIIVDQSGYNNTGNVTEKLLIYDYEPSNPGVPIFLDRMGNVINWSSGDLADVKVIRSGNRNLLGAVALTIQAKDALLEGIS